MKDTHPDANVEVLCHDCTATKYPLKGRFSEETLRKAKGAKFFFKNPDRGKFKDPRGCKGENLWIQIQEVKDGKVYGTLANDPFIIRDIHHGDNIVRKVSEAMELDFE